ncbi:alginate lyase family protein [Tianweitania sediminis]|uniref:Alginate lyase family protein n=1 Tax=Tianweitania sediminis TaxID=1502156 RepID=A0A8J7R9A0_9HYPH|nr:alginate lyase family protein [Tianweitania sediminis]MBP0440622.1 alginate lyase family protein [Tianweitania sediminis]
MASRLRKVVPLLIGVSLVFPAAASEERFQGLFDMAARKSALRDANMKQVRSACLSVPYNAKVLAAEPIKALKSTEGYGSDNSAEDFSWTVMALASAGLGGDRDAESRLGKLLLKWSKAEAFLQTEEGYDPYYALKRLLLPVIVAYGVVEPRWSDEERALARQWIDTLVRRIDARFDREVDRNNHRILADSVLALWGATIGDQALVSQGIARFELVLEEMRPDGTLPLEARRGARALWYQRQTLSSLVVIAEAARGQGQDLYSRETEDGRSFATLLGALLNGLQSPLLVAAYASENHIPGPEKDFRLLDRSFLDQRGHNRHYMAWAEAAQMRGADLSYQRLAGLFDRELRSERPLIDDFIGGNATCFWWQP